MTDDDSTSTLSREDALTLECEDSDTEMRIETYIVEPEDDEDYPDTDSDDVLWPTDEEIAAWEAEERTWRNPDALWGGEEGYDPNGEI